MLSVVHQQGRAISVTEDAFNPILVGKGVPQRCSYQLLPHKHNEGKYIRSTLIYN
jgi:hypothetical protein